MPTQETLSLKEKELIATGASIAAGCQPCTTYHINAVRDAGASDEEINQAVADALCVRNSATKIMGGLAEELMGREPEKEDACCSDKPLIGELVSIGAALAVNCTTNMETHLKRARSVGATEKQIKLALSIAGKIREVAGSKLEAVTTGTSQTESSCCDETPVTQEENCTDSCACHG